jgi:hypothetical protein
VKTEYRKVSRVYVSYWYQGHLTDEQFDELAVAAYKATCETWVDIDVSSGAGMVELHMVVPKAFARDCDRFIPTIFRNADLPLVFVEKQQEEVTE